ncbi:MAG: hypothetical protein HDQ97_06185 [Lachnospiraceae bacterium]|nr:hypothetical protein [Lachnospiraceae bacterium]
MDNIYNAIRYLKPEHQGIILSTYKFTELYDIFANNESYEKYINDLFAVSHEYTNRAIALSALHTEAFLQSRKKKEEFDAATTMCQMFDCMSEADQKRFCEGMLQKKGFFEDAYKVMMDSFQSAVEVKSNDVGSGVAEK